MKLKHYCPNYVSSNDEKEDTLCDRCIQKGYERYFISWLDSYNTFNHADSGKEKSRFAINKSGLKNIKNYHTVFEIEGWDFDGWVDCSHLVIVVAKNKEELNKKVHEVFEENSRNVDVFSVQNDDKTIELTEEDF